MSATYRSRFLDIDGVRTHYLEAGEGPVLVLLHSGEPGACAELSWEDLIPALAEYFRVVAPDWLGFGLTKTRGVEQAGVRMVRHLARFCEVMTIDGAPFVGASMGATYLLHAAAQSPCPLPITSLVAISGSSSLDESSEGGSAPWGQITVPVLLIAGENDCLLAPGCADELADQIPGAQAVVIANCGHCPNVGRPAAVAAEIIDFLEPPMSAAEAAG